MYSGTCEYMTKPIKKLLYEEYEKNFILQSQDVMYNRLNIPQASPSSKYWLSRRSLRVRSGAREGGLKKTISLPVTFSLPLLITACKRRCVMIPSRYTLNWKRGD
eukprot:scaffold2310_cov49-Cylindrotheca_fusiformis.AAC.6